MNRTLSDSTHDKPSLIDELLSIPKQAAIQAEEFVIKVISAGWNLVSHHRLPEWLQVMDVTRIVYGVRMGGNRKR